MKSGEGEDRATLVFFLIDVIQQSQFPSICLSLSDLQPTVVGCDSFTKVMRLFRLRNVVFVYLCII